ncbi:sensor histidine kinase [Pseudofrankia saprophytica]|uniref:sensor histidine kinase n=1 Tax=Pseudofrankia saprophytica TaxID=298655 RepID=UPI000234DC11|nr:sensor histidine kinase [Pseudofrankia saprophytica]
MSTAWSLTRRQLTTAAVAAAAFATAVVGSRIQGPHHSDTRVWWPAAVTLAGVASAALPLHRHHPRAAAALVGACTLALAVLGALLTPMLLTPLLVALYCLASQSGWRTAAGFGAVLGALLATAAVAAGPAERPWQLETIAPLSWLTEPVILGGWARLRRAYLRVERTRAEQAERTREQEARVRVTEERARIARELHDAVTHHLALANAQAGTAAHLMRTHPDKAAAILTELTRGTSAALRDLKAAVGVLRRPEDPDAPLEPAPGLARLADLTSACASAGLAVTVSTEGRPRPLSAGVDLTAFRVVQEALTNVSRHAATPAAHVRLAYARDRLTVTVTDAGPAVARTRAQVAAGTDTGLATRVDAGFGLVGLRERTRSVGGQLRAGHRAGGGFEVRAELPLPPDDALSAGDPARSPADPVWPGHGTGWAR